LSLQALYFVQSQLPKEQLMGIAAVHSSLDLRLGDVESKLNRLQALANAHTATSGGGGARQA
jgi:hypothetical protein